MTTEKKDLPYRFTVVASKEHKDKLDVIAKKYRITQGEAVEVMVDGINVEDFAPLFQAKREAKITERTKINEFQRKLLEKVKNLSPEQIEKLLAQVQS
jgi:hypothetical protein